MERTAKEEFRTRRKEAHLEIDKKLTDHETSILAATSSITARTITAPIERIKLLIQCQNELIKDVSIYVLQNLNPAGREISNPRLAKLEHLCPKFKFHFKYILNHQIRSN